MLSGRGQPLQRGHVPGHHAHAVAEGAQPPGAGPQTHQWPLERGDRLPRDAENRWCSASGWLLVCLPTHCSEYLRTELTKLRIGFCERLLRSRYLFFSHLCLRFKFGMFKVCFVFHFPKCNVLVLSLSRHLSALIFMSVSTQIHMYAGFSNVCFVYSRDLFRCFFFFLVKEIILK